MPVDGGLWAAIRIESSRESQARYSIHVGLCFTVALDPGRARRGPPASPPRSLPLGELCDYSSS